MSMKRMFQEPLTQVKIHRMLIKEALLLFTVIKQQERFVRWMDQRGFIVIWHHKENSS